MIWSNAFKSQLKDTKFQVQLLIAGTAGGGILLLLAHMFKTKHPHRKSAEPVVKINDDVPGRNGASKK